MFRNYLLTAVRNIRRNLGYTFLNVFGLTLGVAACLLVFLVVKNELTYDRYHKQADRTYRVTMNALDFNPSVSFVVTKTIRTNFPQLEHVGQFWAQNEGLFAIGANKFTEKDFGFADQEFINIFDYDWLRGNSQNALTEPNSIVLTESVAKKYFGSDDAMGKVIRFDNEHDMKVTGIVRDLPGNTHLPFRFLISFSTVRSQDEIAKAHFYQISGGYAYIVLPENFSAQQMQSQMPAFIRKNFGDDIAKEAKLIIQPLSEIHFDQRYLNNSFSPTTSKETYYALGAVAVLIIIMASVNFVNLATAQAVKRAREVGVRKVLGAVRGQLIRQFLSETTVLVLLSVLTGLLLTYLVLPWVNTAVGLRLSYTELLRPNILLLIGALTVAVILMAGLYPAFVQSAFVPVKTLKAGAVTTIRGLTLRKSLVVLQFAITQILIIGTLVVALQMDFFKNRDLGFNKDAVVNVFLFDRKTQEFFLEKMRAIPAIKDMSLSSAPPAYNHNFRPFRAEELGITKDDVTEIKFIDEHYLDMFGMKMLAGEKIMKKAKDDTTIKVVVNEALIHKLGVQDPQKALGLQIRVGGEKSIIQGVVANFQSESKHKAIRPCVLRYFPNGFYMASMRLQSADLKETITKIQNVWQPLYPDNLFNYQFTDERIAALYQQEEKVYTAFRIFAGIAILIGCLGLYGLIAFAAAQRTKEMGVRKVLGASVSSIVGLFVKESTLLVVIAFLIAAPIGYYAMDSWLQNFAYKIDLGIPVFAISILVSFAIAFFTIAQQAIKAGLTNPVKSLKGE